MSYVDIECVFIHATGAAVKVDAGEVEKDALGMEHPKGQWIPFAVLEDKGAGIAHKVGASMTLSVLESFALKEGLI